MTTSIDTLQPPFKVKAKYGWSGQTKEDLGFLEGDIMEVTRVTGDWYYGKLLRNRKCTGYFPHNFVILLEEKINHTLKKDETTKQRNTMIEQDLETKTSLPPIPTRERTNPRENSNPSRMYNSETNNNHSNMMQRSPMRSPPIPSNEHARNFDYHNNNNKIPNNKALMVDTNSPTLSEYHYVSSPDLYGQHMVNKSPNSRFPRRQTNPNIFINDTYSSKNPSPALPPLPNDSNPPSPTRNNNINSNNRSRIEHSFKSYSSDDIPTISQQRYSHHKQSSNQYRQQVPHQNNPNNKRISMESIAKSNTNSYSYSNQTSDSTAVFSNSRYIDETFSESENSFALMSDFSATSAGSFARHRHAQSFADSMERSQAKQFTSSFEKDNNNNSMNNNNNNSINGRMGGLLRRMMPKSNDPQTISSSDLPKLPSIQNLNISQNNEAKDWITVKSHVNRSRTLTKYEKHPRYMRALEDDKELVLHPQDSIYNGLNTNEVKQGGRCGTVDILLTEMNYEYIDAMTRKRCVKDGRMKLDSWAQMTFSARYASSLDILRGLYIFCTEMFELIDDNSTTDFANEPKNLDKILHSKYCTPFELTWLFKRLANALGITCEIVIGFLKTPDHNNHEFKYNHCWLRVLVKREWRFIDVILGNVSNPIHEFINNKKAQRSDDSYFLAEPLEFIYTHVPPREFEQHIVPSIDQLSILYLPLVFPSFFKNSLKLYNYSTALSSLEDTEVYECSIEIPNDIEVFSSVVIDGISEEKEHEYAQMELALCQVKKHKSNSGRRIALLKAVLPPGVSKGTLYVHSGIKGSQKTRANVHPLSMVVPLQHKGMDMKYEFVSRIPSENVQNVEMYIKEPQNRYLFSKNEYTFSIIQNPYDGVMYDSISQNSKQQLAIKSPSGKIYELEKRDPQTPFGTWETRIQIKEEGLWTGLVVADSGVGWCPFAEWACT